MIWIIQLVWALQGDVWYEGSPVEDATVYILDERLQSTSVQTDQNGHFDFSNIIEKHDHIASLFTPTISAVLCIHTMALQMNIVILVFYTEVTLFFELEIRYKYFGHIDIDRTKHSQWNVYAVPEEDHLQAQANLNRRGWFLFHLWFAT